MWPTVPGQVKKWTSKRLQVAHGRPGSKSAEAFVASPETITSGRHWKENARIAMPAMLIASDLGRSLPTRLGERAASAHFRSKRTAAGVSFIGWFNCKERGSFLHVYNVQTGFYSFWTNHGIPLLSHSGPATGLILNMTGWTCSLLVFIRTSQASATDSVGLPTRCTLQSWRMALRPQLAEGGHVLRCPLKDHTRGL